MAPGAHLDVSTMETTSISLSARAAISQSARFNAEKFMRLTSRSIFDNITAMASFDPGFPRHQVKAAGRIREGQAGRDTGGNTRASSV
jgi:hypothetical protein